MGHCDQHIHAPVDHRNDLRHNNIFACLRNCHMKSDILFQMRRILTDQTLDAIAKVVDLADILQCCFARSLFRDPRLDHHSDFQQIQSQLLLVLLIVESKRILHNSRVLGHKGTFSSLDRKDIPRDQLFYSLSYRTASNPKLLRQIKFIGQAVAFFQLPFLNQLCDLLGDTFRQRLIFFLYRIKHFTFSNLLPDCLSPKTISSYDVRRLSFNLEYHSF